MSWTTDTNLLSVSPLTAVDIDRFLQRRGSPLTCIGCPVISAQAKYGINATYILAHAIHETGWGTSAICREKHNLYGWMAFDDSPMASATTFADPAECIDYVMGRIRALYLTEGGMYYHGATLAGMNVNYATDKNWGGKIARICFLIEDQCCPQPAH